MSWVTLYQAKTRVRPASSTVPGRIACSNAAAAARSLPSEFIIPRNAAAASTARSDATAIAAPPAAEASASRMSPRLRPMRSPQNVTIAAATAVPAIPAARMTPNAAGAKPSLAR